jgi:poly(beta-D-mannuronate) lyase
MFCATAQAITLRPRFRSTGDWPGLIRTPMRTIRLAAALCLFFPGVLVFAAPLRSPWDAFAIHQTSRPYACPSAAPLPRDLVAYDYYSDKRYSIPDPARLHAWRQASSAYNNVMLQAIHAADFYLRSGSRPAAACVLRLLDTQAAAQSMTGAMASNQSYYLRNWTLGSLAVAYLKVRDADAGTPAERSHITAWLASLARSTQDYFSVRHAKRAKDGRNNHLYWAGFAVMSSGIAAGNRHLYNWGVMTYRYGVGRITPAGTLPLEMARGRRALHYHLFAAAPLVTMAELAEANGQDLYAIDHGAFHRLVDRCVAGLENNSWFAQQTGFPQDTPGPRLLSSDVAWIQPYERRFPNPAIRQLLSHVSSLEFNFLGGNPPPVTRADTEADKPAAQPESLSTR